MTFRNTFEEYFKTADYNDDGVYANFYRLVVKDLTSEAAFNLIPEVVDYLLELSDSSYRYHVLEVILSLAGMTGTTEMPNGLKSKVELIEKAFENGTDYQKSKVAALKKWYRLS